MGFENDQNDSEERIGDELNKSDPARINPDPGGWMARPANIIPCRWHRWSLSLPRESRPGGFAGRRPLPGFPGPGVRSWRAA